MDNLRDMLKFLSIIIVVAGLIGAVATVASFDHETYKYVKENKEIYEEEVEIMSVELTSTWVTAVAIAMASLVTGVVMAVLNRMLGAIESIEEKLSKGMKGLTNEHKEKM